MTAGQLLAGATLRLGWPSESAVISLMPGPATTDGGYTQPARVAMEGEVLIAGDRSERSTLEIADVICCPAGPGSAPAAAAELALSRYPGAAVVASPCGGHRCRVVTHTGYRFAITVAGPGLTGAQATVLGATFAHCWLAAGCPAMLLESAELMADAGGSVPRWIAAEDVVTPVPFGIFLNWKRKVPAPIYR